MVVSMNIFHTYYHTVAVTDSLQLWTDAQGAARGGERCCLNLTGKNVSKYVFIMSLFLKNVIFSDTVHTLEVVQQFTQILDSSKEMVNSLSHCLTVFIQQDEVCYSLSHCHTVFIQQDYVCYSLSHCLTVFIQQDEVCFSLSHCHTVFIQHDEVCNNPYHEGHPYGVRNT